VLGLLESSVNAFSPRWFVNFNWQMAWEAFLVLLMFMGAFNDFQTLFSILGLMLYIIVY
jgi:hypothetical protein